MTALGKLLLAIAGILLGVSVYMHFTIGFWGDQDWELLVSRMLLSGKTLYIDHVPVNPPLIFWLYTLPVALSLHTPLQDFQALVLLGLCAIAAAIAVCTRLITSHPAFTDNPSRRVQFVVLLCFLFIFRIASAFFADREHIFLVLTFPYLIRWMPSLSRGYFSGRLRFFVGALAAAGFCIKPHCLLLFIGIQLICLLRKDRPRILLSLENYVIYAFATLYLLAMIIFTPDYFTTVLPMTLFTYSAISAGPGTLFDFTLIITLFFTFVMFRPRQTSPYRRDIWYLLSASFFLLLYGLLNSGWGYTYQPIITLLLFVNGFVLWEFLYLKRDRAARGLPVWPFQLGVAACVFNFVSKAYIVLLYFMAVLAVPCHGDNACPGYYSPFVKELQDVPMPHSFGTIGMDFSLWSRVSKLAGAAWDTRFPQLWMIPKFIVSPPEFSNAHKWILYYVAGALADDLDTHKPEIVFVDKSDTIYTITLSKPLDWVAALNNFDNFRSAWERYAYVHTIDRCDAMPPAQEVGLAMVKRRIAHPSNCRFDVYHRLP